MVFANFYAIGTGSHAFIYLIILVIVRLIIDVLLGFVRINKLVDTLATGAAKHFHILASA